MGRVRGYALFLGARAAADGGGPEAKRAAAAAGWAYAAALLNALPPTRAAATALDGFLTTGGSALHAAYGRQFLKLLAALDAHFLPALDAARADAGTRAPAVRLRTYLHAGAFRKVPEGRDMPLADSSAYDRA